MKVLKEARFAGVEKIKTIGSTYMAASGLRPQSEVSMNIIISSGKIVVRMDKQCTPPLGPGLKFLGRFGSIGLRGFFCRETCFFLV